MPAVVAVGEGISAVDDSVREHAVAPCEGVAQPAGGRPGFLLYEEFDSAGESFSHLHIVLPVRGIPEEGGAVAVFQDIVHPFPVSFQRELPSGDAAIVSTHGYLVGGDGFDLVGDGHPEVDGQGDLRGREQMHVLGHARVGGLCRPVAREVVLCAHPRLQRPVGLAHGVEQGGVQAGIQGEPVPDADVILRINRHLMSVEDGVAAGGEACVDLNVGLIAFKYISSQRFRDESMVHVLRAEFHQMPGGRGVVEVYLGRQIPHSGVVVDGVDILALHSVVHIHVLDVEADLHLVASVGDGGVREEFAVEDVVPAECG